MMMWKSPPKAKVYEAISAVLDGRVEIFPDSKAKVTSSGLDKSYAVKWIEGTAEITSSDPASRFQGYIGYPIIAVLLATNRIPFDRELAQPLKGVQWKTINDKFKRDYGAAVDYVLVEAGVDAQARERLDRMVDEVYQNLIAMDLQKPSSK